VILQNPIDEQGPQVHSLWKGVTNHERLRTTGVDAIISLWIILRAHVQQDARICLVVLLKCASSFQIRSNNKMWTLCPKEPFSNT